MAVYGPAIWINISAPTIWTFYRAYTSALSLAIPQSGWYRIYCIGKSGDGGPNGTSSDQKTGSGGGGSGGLSVSNLLLSSGVTVPITFTDGIARFGEFLYATPGTNGVVRTGGSGGNGVGGNAANFTGFSGGNGGSEGYGPRAPNGIQGENEGMIGGYGGISGSSSQTAGGGGGGGARLPGDSVCSYIYTPSLSAYRAAGGGHQSVSSGSTPSNSMSFPSLSLDASMKLYGGGGGGGGHGHFGGTDGGLPSSGTPAVIIIEVSA